MFSPDVFIQVVSMGRLDDDLQFWVIGIKREVIGSMVRNHVRKEIRGVVGV
jgi:hypothetical protein